jgi:hypothetical protein
VQPGACWSALFALVTSSAKWRPTLFADLIKCLDADDLKLLTIKQNYNAFRPWNAVQGGAGGAPGGRVLRRRKDSLARLTWAALRGRWPGQRRLYTGSAPSIPRRGVAGARAPAASRPLAAPWPGPRPASCPRPSGAQRFLCGPCGRGQQEVPSRPARPCPPARCPRWRTPRRTDTISCSSPPGSWGPAYPAPGTHHARIWEEGGPPHPPLKMGSFWALPPSAL